MNIWEEMLGNQVLVCAVSGWIVAQVLKTILDCILNRSFNPERLFGSGGMPSSHSATVCALTTASGIKYGAGSFEFAVSFVLSMIVMYDAMNVRMETGKQAMILNEIIDSVDIIFSNDVAEVKLKEMVGHTLPQVLAGITLGIIDAIVMYNIFFS